MTEGGTAGPAVRMWARSELGRRWKALVALGVTAIEDRRFARYRAGPVRAGAPVTIEFPRGPFRFERLVPVIAKTFPLDRAGDAHRYMQARGNVGKIVLTV